MRIPRNLGDKLRTLPGDWQTQSSMLENYSLETTYSVLQRFETLYREKHKFMDMGDILHQDDVCSRYVSLYLPKTRWDLRKERYKE